MGKKTDWSYNYFLNVIMEYFGKLMGILISHTKDKRKHYLIAG